MTTMQLQQTSLFAYYNDVKPTLGHRQKTIYEALGKRDNFTNCEMATYLDWPINTVVPRVSELRKMGLVRMAGIRKCNITGRKVIAWEVGKLI